MYTDVGDDEGQSPLDIALENPYDIDGCVDVALYLMSRGGDEDKAELLCAACRWGKLSAVKELVEQHKVDPKSECDNIIILQMAFLVLCVHLQLWRGGWPL